LTKSNSRDVDSAAVSVVLASEATVLAGAAVSDTLPRPATDGFDTVCSGLFVEVVAAVFVAVVVVAVDWSASTVVSVIVMQLSISA